MRRQGMRLALGLLGAAAATSAEAQQANVSSLMITSGGGANAVISSSNAGGGTGNIFMMMPATSNLFRLMAGPTMAMQADGTQVQMNVPLIILPNSNVLSDPFTSYFNENLLLTGNSNAEPSLNLMQVQESVNAPSGLEVLSVNDYFGGTAMTGVRNFLSVSGGLNAPSGNPQGTQYSGEQVTVTSSSSDNGTPTAPAGALWAVNHVAAINAGATNWQSVIGNETDIAAAPGTSLQDKYGLSLVLLSNDVVQASRDSIGIVYGTQSPTGPGWKVGLSFGGYAGYYPISPSGTMIGAKGHTNTTFTVANGIDWHLGTFTGNSWDDGHISFTGSGHIVAANARPTLSNCGNGAQLDPAASDLAGTVTPGSGTVFTECTITFAHPFDTPPHCGVTGWSPTPPYILAETNAELVVHAGTNRFTYHSCTQ